MLFILSIISLIFITGLVLRTKTRTPLCALCLSISATWLGLLFLYKTNHYHDQVLLSLLMGQTITGVFYYAVRHLPKTLRVFSLPFFLSLTAIFYILITNLINLSIFMLLTFLWLMAWLLFVWRNDPGKKSLSKIVANCCEDL